MADQLAASALPAAPASPLALTGVLAVDLPVDFGTTEVADFYDVPADFNRCPDGAELHALRGPDGHHRLMEAGYPGVTMAVVDSRLIIGHTNLAELEHGLAMVVATFVDSVNQETLHARDLVRAAQSAESDVRVRRQRDAVGAAGRIRFTPESPNPGIS